MMIETVAPTFDESSLDEDERKLLSLMRQVVEETLRPLFEERWPDFSERLMQETLRAAEKQDDQIPNLIRRLVDEAVSPLKSRLDQIEARLFRRGL
jgi:tRNA(Ile)-lysidine synthase TilS/MesJ